MEPLGLTSTLLILAAGLLWGATDAVVKTLTPPQLRRNSGGLTGVLQDFLALLACPGYLVCQVESLQPRF